MQILVVSPRVAPGLLTLSAWDALRAAPAVRAAELDDPHVEAIVSAGIAVEATPAAPSYEADAVWIAPAGDVGWAHEVATDLMGADDHDGQSHVEIIFGSYDQPGARLLDLVEVMDQLRTKCPWTKQQTHASLSHYLLEEAYETLESLDSGDTDHLREELGDLLMQVVFHARIAAESDGWDIDTVAEGIVAKLIYRNPHVFGDETSPSADDVTAEDVDVNWQALKAVEKQRSSPLEGIPAQMPALAFAAKVLSRIGEVTVDGNDFGSRLLALVQEARAEGVNAEEALRKAVRSLL